MRYYHYFQLLASIGSWVFYKNLRDFKMAGFALLCTSSFLIDLAGVNMTLFNLASNHGIANFFILTATPLIFYIYYQILPLRPGLKKWYRTISYAVVLFIILNYLFFEGPLKFNIISIIFQQFFSIVLCFLLLFYLATSEKVFDLLTHPYFWIAAGLLIFSLGTLVVLGMSQYIRIHNITIANITLYRAIMPILNVILSSSYFYAFYLCNRKQKLYSQLSL